MATEKLLQTGFYNNRFTKASQIKIHPDNLAIGRGYAAFEFFRIINGLPFYLDRHLDRFFNTLKLLRLNVNYSRHQLQEIISEIIQKNEQLNYFIKMYALPGNSIKLNQTARMLILPVQIEEIPSYLYDQGVSLILKEYARFLPEAKSTNYLPSVFWQNEMEEAKASDVLYYYDNKILECSRGNIFIVKNGQIISPFKNILKGITRSIVIDIIQSHQMPFKATEINPTDLFAADEVFISSTSKLIMPVVNVKGAKIGDGKPGKISTELLNLFQIHLISNNKSLFRSN
ncbi:MAG: aminotransferase class IV [Bacteroidales bacterium]|nr:aminotransferase class IV [Bacteroidales bacterium]